MRLFILMPSTINTPIIPFHVFYNILLTDKHLKPSFKKKCLKETPKEQVNPSHPCNTSLKITLQIKLTSIYQNLAEFLVNIIAYLISYTAS